MLRIKLLRKKLENLIEERDSFNEELESLNKRSEELETEIDKANDEEALRKVEEEIDENQKEIEELENKKAEKEKEIEEIEKEIEELQRKAPKFKEGEKRDMNLEERRKSVETFIRSKGNIRDNSIKTTDVGVLIPKDISNKVTEQKAKIIDLSKYVTVVKVNTGAGKYPILKKTKAKLSTVEELTKNPDLAKPDFLEVDWKVDTYRGAIPISQESIDDSEVDLLGLIERQAEIQKINTKNFKIAEILKTFTSKEFTKLDEVITLLDVDLDIAYSRTAIMTQTFFNKLHIIKDKMGRYMWDTSLISNSQNEYIPVEIEIVPDELLGNKGEAKAFIGDVESAILLTDRKDLSVKWLNHEIYGEYLQAGLRFGVTKADTESGFFVTLNLAEV